MLAVRKHNRMVWVIGPVFVLALLISCNPRESSPNASAGAPTTNEADTRDWEKVIYECISRVEQSDAVFYRRGKRVTGKEVAQEMRKSMRIILRVKSLPDGFGRNAGILLAAITTYEGYAMDGITGPPTPFEVEVGGKRIKVYDWLKQELGLEMLPGEEEGHEIFLPLYDAVVAPELSRRWEEYLDRCIKATEQARDCRFYLQGKYYTPAEAAQIFASNRAEALEYLKNPDIKYLDDKDLYESGSVLRRLTRRPIPSKADYADRREFSKEVERWTFEPSSVEHNSRKEKVIDWLMRNAGEPPPMPELRKKGQVKP